MSENKAVTITNKRKGNLRIDISNYRNTVQWLLSQLRQDPEALRYSQWCASIDSLYGEIWNQARVKTHFSRLAKELGCDASPKELLFVLQSLYAILVRGVVFYHLDKIQPANYSSIHEVLKCITSSDFYRERWGVHNLLPELWGDGFLSAYDEKEISKAFYPVMRLATSLANQLKGSVPSWANLLTDLYEEIIPRQIRHDLGEYFTPYWLAERTIKMSGFRGDLKSVLLDPGCGSGVFPLAAAEMKYQANKDKSQEEVLNNSILQTVVGCDINPLCVLTARLSMVCWLALKFGLPLPDVKIPVLHYDTVFKRPASEQFDDINSILPDGCDYLVGNPPWISWNSLPGGYRKQIERQLLPEYALFDFHGQEAQLGHSNDDYLVTFTLVTIHRYLKEGGLCSFIIKQPLLTNVSGKTFRRFSVRHVRENVQLGVKEVADLRRVNPFGIGNETAIIVLKRGDKTVYPVPYETWSKSDGEIVVEKGEAKALSRDITSPWVVLTQDLKETEFMEGNCVYEIRHGLKHDVADVLIVRPIERNGDRLIVQRILEDDKEVYEIEAEAVYPFFQPRHISAWEIKGYTYVIIPQRKAGEDNEEKLARTLPLTYKYLERFKDRFTARKSRIFTQKPFYGLFGLGAYTWKPYKVCWCGLGFKPEFVVLSTVRDRLVGERLPIPDGTIYFIPLDREEEAHFVCAMLNSELVRKFLSARSGKSKRGLSKKVMEQLSLPRFNPNDNRHLELASWSLKMHQGLKMPDEEGNKIEYLVGDVFRTQREWQQGIFSFVEVPHSV